jgi:nucleoside-diphosphate-sugar epimerase
MCPAPKPLPDRIKNVDQLEDLLSEPTDAAVDALARLDGDLLILGVAGKMGPTLARMARRASQQAGVHRRIIGVARFTDPSQENRLRPHGIEPIPCDLLDPDQLARLPEIPNVLYMVGMKFGSTGQEARTWAVNCWLPGMVCRKFSRARIVAFSTGNVYGLVPVSGGGSRETDPPAPVGEYAMSCLGRERMFEHFSRTLQIPMVLLRLNYAAELRYGVLVDIAQKVQAGLPIDLAMGYLNAIWQADANAMTLAAFSQAATPPAILNLAGPELLSVRGLAEDFGRLLGRPVAFAGRENADALLSNGELARRLFGKPRVNAEQMVRWVAEWLTRGGETLGKPTHFEVRDGKF